MQEDFRIAVESRSGDVAVVTVEGDADLHSAPELREALTDLIDEGADRVIVDLSRATFVDSMTLGVLLGSTKRLRLKGGGLDVVVPGPEIRRIFEITMLDRVFDLHASRAEALSVARVKGDAG